MRAARATLAVATIALLIGASTAGAEPATVHVRIEGITQTLVDRVVRTDGHDVRASSDSQPRRCDGANAGRNARPGPTATAAAVDALAALGQGFDGRWYPGFDDYFIQQWGPEREDNDKLWWWGLIVNRKLAGLGGCQLRVRDGDEVLWANDAFSGRPFLWLSAASARPTVTVGAPLKVTVGATDGGSGAATPAPYAGATVEAVTANGQPAGPGVADGGVSGADGSATITFRATGWQRVKARGPAGGPGGAPAAIASNSIDVCVEATAGAGCDGAPPSQRPPGGGGGGATTGGKGGPQRPGKGARPVWMRQFAPRSLRDDRARGLRWTGRWKRLRSSSAWRKTLSRGGRGAAVRVRLAGGRPAFLLRLTGASARFELRAGRRSAVAALPAVSGGGARVVRGPRLPRGGGVASLRVLSGVVRVDGVGRAAR